MKYNRSAIMKKAHKFYTESKLMATVDVRYAKTFSECLKQSWAQAKEAANPTVKAYVVPNWKMHEVALFGVRSNVIKETEIERETAKAFKAFGEWFPKSICDVTRVAA